MSNDRDPLDVLVSIESEVSALNEKLEMGDKTTISSVLKSINGQLGAMNTNSSGMNQTDADTDTDADGDVTYSDPWEKHDRINKGNYIALELIHEHGDTPTTKEINPAYEKRFSGQYNGDGLPASPRVTELYKSGFVDRTPNQPYRYWLTEQGKEVLHD